MPVIEVDDSFDMYYEVDSFAEPWRQPETILLVHGVCGSTEEWYAWMPLLTRRYRVVRVDLRGWGRSSIPPEGYSWSMDNYADDVARFMDLLELGRVHFVGTKLGGRIGLHLSLRHPGKLLSLGLVCTPMTIKLGDQRIVPNFPRTQSDLEGWARRTMGERLGDVPEEMLEWWIGLYGRCSPRVVHEVLTMAWSGDEYGLLDQVRVPTVVIDNDAETPFDQIRTWQTRIPDSVFMQIPRTTEGRQTSASQPIACAAALLDYLDSREFGSRP